MKILVTAAAVTFAAGAVLAGEPATFGIGSRVRVEPYGGTRIVGVLAATDADNLTVSISGAEQRVIKWSEIRKIEVSRGRRAVGWRVLAGAGIGLAVSTAASVGIMNSMASDGVFDPAWGDATAVSGGVILAGTTMGAVMGARSSGERWTRVGQGTEVSVRPVASRGGAGLSVRVAF